MGAERLSSRAIIGEYYKTLEQDIGSSWVGQVTNLFTSDQASEEYAWLGQVPTFREWIGGRQAKGFRENGILIPNKHFEATIEVLVRELRRDKTGQVLARIRELASRTNAHWASLLSTLLINGEATVCYDGQFFFDTDHVDGDSGSQSNDLAVNLQALPVQVHGVGTAPSVEELQLAVTTAIQSIVTFKDDQGEPWNENARSFLVLLPVALWSIGSRALYVPSDTPGPTQTTLAGPRAAGFGVSFAANARLTDATKFYVFRTDSEIKPLIRQEETQPVVKAIAEGSELEFKEDKHQYGVDAWRNVAYGLWQHSALVTMSRST